MSATINIEPLRRILGEHSESVWSDTDLRGFLDTSNLTVWKLICDQAPDLVTFPYYFILGGDQNMVNFETVMTSATGGTVAKNSGIGARVATVSAVYETSNTSGDGNESWRKLDVKLGHGQFPVFENQNSLLNDLELPNIYQERMAVFDYGTQSLQIHPKPSSDHKYLVLLIPEAPIYIKTALDSAERTRFVTESISNDSELLGAERFTGDAGKTVAFHCHLAVHFDAAYQASFSDKSLRREFAAERDRLIALMATSSVMSIDEAY